MIYRFRIILDAKEDIVRDIEVEGDSSLEDFHYAIIQSFGFQGEELATFYKSDEKWNQGEEVPLFDMEEGGENSSNVMLSELFDEHNHHLIYVYDFLLMWTFYVELMEVGEKDYLQLYPNLIFSSGILPEDPPEKSFVSDLPKEEDDFEDGDDLYSEGEESYYNDY